MLVLQPILGKLDFDFVFIDGEHRPFADLPRLLSGLSVGQKAVGYPQQHAAESRRSLILTEAVAARQVFSASQP
jgi:hypothetical protein